jgi:hypothetical protein
MVMHTLDTITTDIGGVLLLEQHTSPSKSGVVVEQVAVDAAASKVTLVVLVLMLLRHFVQLVIHLLDNHLVVLLSVECAGKFM